jgi:hypothetical protein
VREKGELYREEPLSRKSQEKEGIVYEKNEICEAVNCRLSQRSSLLTEKEGQ